MPRSPPAEAGSEAGGAGRDKAFARRRSIRRRRARPGRGERPLRAEPPIAVTEPMQAERRTERPRAKTWHRRGKTRACAGTIPWRIGPWRIGQTRKQKDGHRGLLLLKWLLEPGRPGRQASAAKRWRLNGHMRIPGGGPTRRRRSGRDAPTMALRGLAARSRVHVIPDRMLIQPAQTSQPEPRHKRAHTVRRASPPPR